MEGGYIRGYITCSPPRDRGVFHCLMSYTYLVKLHYKCRPESGINSYHHILFDKGIIYTVTRKGTDVFLEMDLFIKIRPAT